MRTIEKVLWFVAGASIGAGVALLYAPQSGKDTRKLICKTANETKDSLVETGGRIKDTVTEAGESIRATGRDLYRRGAGAASGAAAVLNRVRV
jgi:gas vesicle protein